jgi:hypothetical protein
LGTLTLENLYIPKNQPSIYRRIAIADRDGALKPLCTSFHRPFSLFPFLRRGVEDGFVFPTASMKR